VVAREQGGTAAVAVAAVVAWQRKDGHCCSLLPPLACALAADGWVPLPVLLASSLLPSVVRQAELARAMAEAAPLADESTADQRRG